MTAETKPARTRKPRRTLEESIKAQQQRLARLSAKHEGKRRPEVRLLMRIVLGVESGQRAASRLPEDKRALIVDSLESVRAAALNALSSLDVRLE